MIPHVAKIGPAVFSIVVLLASPVACYDVQMASDRAAEDPIVEVIADDGAFLQLST